jgi:O-antigen/teichoic acid export membrane protein
MTIAVEAGRRALGSSPRLARAMTKIATIGDQLLVAISNFGLTLSISRAYGAEEIAAYGIGLSVALMIQGLQRQAITIPLTLQNTSRVLRRRGGIFAQHMLVLGIVLMLGAATLLFDAFAHLGGLPLLVLASSATCLLVYAEIEFARAMLVKLGQPLFLLGSAMWYAAVSGGVSAAALFHVIGYLTLLGIIAAAMLLHAAVLGFIVGKVDLRQGARLLTSDIRRYGFWAFVAALTYSGYTHFPLFILGAVAEPIHAASFVATRSLMQPLQILLRGLDIADKSIFASSDAPPHSRRAFALIMRQAIPYAAAAALFCIIIFYDADGLIALTYGEKFAHATPSLIAWAPAFFLLSVCLPFESLVYARQEFRKYYLIRTIGSVIALAVTLPMIWEWGSVGAIIACGIGNLIAMCGTLRLLWRGSRP